MGEEKKKGGVPPGKGSPGRPRHGSPKAGKRPRGTGRPPKKAEDTLPTNLDRVVYLKTVDPALSAEQVAAKLGLSVGGVEKIMMRPEYRKRMELVSQKVTDKVADKYNDLVSLAMDKAHELLEGRKSDKETDRWLQASMVRDILGPIFKREAAKGADDGVDEVEFAVVVQDDGTIAQKVTRRRKGEAL